jgi:oligopeptide/dipeptide ABC transporter ATP-binding protein
VSSLAEISSIAVSFPRTDRSRRRVVDGISVRVEDGSTGALVGESGSGKSLTALALLGLIPEPGRVEAGTIVLAEVDVRTASEVQLERLRGTVAGLLLQDTGQALDPVARIADQVTEALHVRRRLPRSERLRLAEAALAEVGLDEPDRLARAFPHQLSGGQQQRALLAAALAAAPRLLVADEPTSALDPVSTTEILALLQELQRSRGMALLLISHDLPAVARVAATVTVVYAGETVESGTAKAVLDTPAHPYTRALALASRLEKARDGSFATIPGAPLKPDEWGPSCRFAPRCPAVMPRCRLARPALASGPDSRPVRCFLAHDQEEPHE